MKNKFALVAVVMLGLVAVLGCGKLAESIRNGSPEVGGDRNASPAFRGGESDSFSLAGREWQRYDIDNTDIAVELPASPADKTPDPSQIPPGAKAIFSAMKVHSFDEADFQSSYTQLEPTGARKFQIKELADTSMAAIKRQVRDLTYTLDVVSDTKAKYNGNFKRNGKSYELKGCCIYQKTNPSRVWAVITVYPTDNADGRTASQRIIDSARFAGSTEVCN